MTSLTKFCYAVILGNKPGERIGAISFGETGYYAVRGWDDPAQTLDEVKAFVAQRNELIGVPADVAESMFHASMFGWTAPCADRAIEHFNPKAKVAR